MFTKLTAVQFTCDLCGTVVVITVANFDQGTLPDKWTRTVGNDICPKCQAELPKPK